MEQLTTRIGIEPGPGLVGRFGDTVILIRRGQATAGLDEAAQELLGLAAEVGSDRQAPASAIASRLAAWVLGHMSGDAPAFGIVAPMRDGVVMFLRGAVWCTITEGGSAREISGEQALTWVDQIVPGTFERLAIGAAAGRPVQADPLSDLRGGVVPGQGFVLSRTAGIPGPEPALAETDADVAETDADWLAEDSETPTWPRLRPPAAAASRGHRPRRYRGRRPTRRRRRGRPAPRPTTTSRRWSRGPANTSWRPAELNQAQLNQAQLNQAQLNQAQLNAGSPAEADRPQTVRVGAQPSPAVLPTTMAPVQSRPMTTQRPVGVLISADGPPIVLDRVYVLGREPHQDPAVESGEAFAGSAAGPGPRDLASACVCLGGERHRADP